MQLAERGDALMRPGPQAVHGSRPVCTLKLPGGQSPRGVQIILPVSPLVLDPAAHGVQLVEPVPDANWSSGHGVQLLLPPPQRAPH